MGIWRSTTKTFVDVPSWMGWDNLKAQTRFFLSWLKPITHFPRKVKLEEKLSFEEVMARNNITEADLKTLSLRFIMKALLYGGLGLLCLSYALYLFIQRSLFPGISAVLLAAVVFLHAFSMHLFYFQIKRRQLGCSFTDWLSGKIGENRS